MKRYIGLLASVIIVLLTACGQFTNITAICSNCNAKITENSNFCANCGTQLIHEQTENFFEKKDTNIPSSQHEHDFKEADCLSPVSCVCGETINSPLGHDYDEGVCARCGTSDPQYNARTLVYQDSNVIIYFKKVTQEGIVFEVENLTEATITIQADAIALNHLSTNMISMSDDVAPLSIGDVIASCNFPDVGPIGIISGQLCVIDFDGSFESYDATFVDIIVNPDVVTSVPTISSPVLYSDEKVNIYYKGIDNEGVYFWVENKTDIVITLQADAVSINKRSNDQITMSDPVAPYSVGIIHAGCSLEDTPSIVETVGGSLSVIDFNYSFESYDATFINVPVL